MGRQREVYWGALGVLRKKEEEKPINVVSLEPVSTKKWATVLTATETADWEPPVRMCCWHLVALATAVLGQKSDCSGLRSEWRAREKQSHHM